MAVPQFRAIVQPASLARFDAHRPDGIFWHRARSLCCSGLGPGQRNSQARIGGDKITAPCLPYNSRYSGSLPGFHLMLQPMLGICAASTGRSSSTASTALRRSLPVTGTLLPGRLESNWPR
jgi:hypothetical protein